MEEIKMKKLISCILSVVVLFYSIPLLANADSSILAENSAYNSISAAIAADKVSGTTVALAKSEWEVFFGETAAQNMLCSPQTFLVTHYGYNPWQQQTVKEGLYGYNNKDGAGYRGLMAYDTEADGIQLTAVSGSAPKHGILINSRENKVIVQYTATKSENLHLYDSESGNISVIQYIGSANTCTNPTASAQILLNGKQIWKNELFSSTVFPDLELRVTSGSKIQIVIEKNGTGCIALNPVLESISSDVAAKAFEKAIANDKANNSNNALKNTNWSVVSSTDEIENLVYYQYYGVGKFKTSSGDGWYGTDVDEDQYGLHYGYEGVTAYSDGDFSILKNNQNADVPKSGLQFTVGYGGKKFFGIRYTAPKDGRVTLCDSYDGYITSVYKIGSITTNSLAGADHKAKFAIYKNNQKIWPTNSECFEFSNSETYLPFPEINGIYVEKGDTINLVFERNTAQFALCIAMNPEVRYETIQGDMTEDGRIDIRDLVHMKKFLSQTSDYEQGFDLDLDGEITSYDMVLMRKYLMGVIPSFNCDFSVKKNQLTLKPLNVTTVKRTNNKTEYTYDSSDTNKGTWIYMTGNAATDGLNVEKFIQYDISQLKNSTVKKARLHFNTGGSDSGAINFYKGDKAYGNLYIQSIKTPEKWDETSFSEFYENGNIIETEWKVRKYIGNNFYNFNDSEMETIDFDLTEHLQNIIDEQKTAFGIRFDYLTDKPLDEPFVLYGGRVVLEIEAEIPVKAEQISRIGFTQKGNYTKTAVGSIPKSLSNGCQIEGSVYSYLGSLSSPIECYPEFTVYSVTTGDTLKTYRGNNVILDGTGKSIKCEISLSKFNLKNIAIEMIVKSGDDVLYSSILKQHDEVIGVYPERIYTVTDDSDANRNYSLPIYTDYLYNFNTGIKFSTSSGLSDHFDLTNAEISEFTSGSNILSRNIDLPLYSDKYYISDKSVLQTSVLSSKKTSGKIRLLCLGDSVTDGYGSSVPYYQYTQDLFYKEAVDFNDENREIMTLGTNMKSKTFSYKDNSYTVRSYSEGRGGWTISNFLYHPSCILYKNDYTALGGDLTGILDPLTYIHSHAFSSTTQPVNPFFDNDKNGEVKFSISKWLERYRTHDKDGNKLTLGNGTGTLITADNIDRYTVCEPTHVLIQFGHNDLRIYPSEQFRKNVWSMIATLKSELPNAIIILSMTPPSLGCYNTDMYSDYQGGSPAGGNWFDNARYLNDCFAGYNERENSVYLLPTYFVTPTAEAYNSEAVSPELHPNETAHFNWGYQLYALLKYIG